MNYWVLSGFTGFYRVLPGFPMFTGFYRVLLGFAGFFPSFAWFYWDI